MTLLSQPIKYEIGIAATQKIANQPLTRSMKTGSSWGLLH